jgi:hypothetical protein
MSNIVRFQPKPPSLAVDYGTPFLRPGSRLEMWGQTFRLIQRTATGKYNLQNVDTGDIETLDWNGCVALWKADNLRITAIDPEPARHDLAHQSALEWDTLIGIRLCRRPSGQNCLDARL